MISRFLNLLTYPLHLVLKLSKMLALGQAEVVVGKVILRNNVSWVCSADGDDGGGAFRALCATAAVNNGGGSCSRHGDGNGRCVLMKLVSLREIEDYVMRLWMEPLAAGCFYTKHISYTQHQVATNSICIRKWLREILKKSSHVPWV